MTKNEILYDICKKASKCSICSTLIKPGDKYYWRLKIIKPEGLEPVFEDICINCRRKLL